MHFGFGYRATNIKNQIRIRHWRHWVRVNITYATSTGRVFFIHTKYRTIRYSFSMAHLFISMSSELLLSEKQTNPISFRGDIDKFFFSWLKRSVQHYTWEMLH